MTFINWFSIKQLKLLYLIVKIHKSNWILVFFMLWLPVQGVTAAVLSVCAVENRDMKRDSAIITSENHHHEDCQDQMNNETKDDHAPSSQSCGDTSCNINSNLLLSVYASLLLDNNPSTIAVLNYTFTSFIPEQPQRPPLTASL